MKPENSNYIEVFPNYRDNIEEKQIPFYHTDLSSIIENIDFKEKPEKNKNILEKLFTDKSKTLKATLEEIYIHNSQFLNLNVNITYSLYLYIILDIS